jgi:hypothetical protein
MSSNPNTTKKKKEKKEKKKILKGYFKNYALLRAEWYKTFVHILTDVAL